MSSLRAVHGPQEGHSGRPEERPAPQLEQQPLPEGPALPRKQPRFPPADVLTLMHAHAHDCSNEIMGTELNHFTHDLSLLATHLGRADLTPALEGVLPRHARSPAAHAPSVGDPLQGRLPPLQVVLNYLDVHAFMRK